MPFKLLKSIDGILSGCLAKWVGLPFLLVGLWMTVSMVQGLYFGLAFENWKQIEGTLHRSESRFLFQPDLEVGYEVDGKTYRTDRLSYGAITKSSDHFLHHYEDGATLELWLDPSHPERAVLMRPSLGATSGVLALGLALTTIGGFLCFARARPSVT